MIPAPELDRLVHVALLSAGAARGEPVPLARVVDAINQTVTTGSDVVGDLDVTGACGRLRSSGTLNIRVETLVIAGDR